MSSSQDADAAILDTDPSDAGMLASWGVSKGCVGSECVGGSLGDSSGVDESLWRPEGVRGRRRVPLLGAGVRLSESQMML